jgi:hypothetical protein
VLAVDTRIGQAISDAADAQATADGKVTTFVSASAPTADAVGDLWLDSDDGNKLYRWNGSAWVALPVGTGGLGIDAATTTYADETGADSVSIGSGGGTNFKNGASRIYANTTGRNVVLQFDAEVTGLHFSAGATLASPDDYVVAQWVFEVNGTPVQSDSFIDSAGDSVPPDATAQTAGAEQRRHGGDLHRLRWRHGRQRSNDLLGAHPASHLCDQGLRRGRSRDESSHTYAPAAGQHPPLRR